MRSQFINIPGRVSSSEIFCVVNLKPDMQHSRVTRILCLRPFFCSRNISRYSDLNFHTGTHPFLSINLVREKSRTTLFFIFFNLHNDNLLMVQGNILQQIRGTPQYPEFQPFLYYIFLMGDMKSPYRKYYLFLFHSSLIFEHHLLRIIMSDALLAHCWNLLSVKCKWIQQLLMK